MHVAEDEEHALVRVAVTLEDVARGNGLGRIPRCRHRLPRDARPEREPPFSAAQSRERALTGDREQPCLDVLDLGKPVPFAQDGEERLLEELPEPPLVRREQLRHLKRRLLRLGHIA